MNLKTVMVSLLSLLVFLNVVSSVGSEMSIADTGYLSCFPNCVSSFIGILIRHDTLTS
jgi:hypothetical protein